MKKEQVHNDLQRPDLETVAMVVELDQALNGRGTVDLSFFLHRLADPQRIVSDKALKSIMSLVPMASLPVRWKESIPDKLVRNNRVPRWIYRSCEGWGEAGGFLDLCVQKLQTLPDGAIDAYLNRLALLQGCHRELPDKLKRAGKDELASLFVEKAVHVHNTQYPKQICFSPTLCCQLNCPYCISAGLLTDEKNTITQEKAVRLINWAKKHGVERICISGGEPTLHPRFKDMISYIKQSGMDVILATNGLCDSLTTESIIDNQVSSVTLHLTPEILKGDHLRTYTRTARQLLDAGIDIAIRINLLTPQDDPGPYIDEADKIGISNLRVAIPIPNFERHNYFVRAEHLSEFGKLIAQCVTEAESRHIHLSLAKPFPLCKLPEKVAKSFLSDGSMISNCQVHMQEFSHNLVVYPDLTYSPCLALNSISPECVLDRNGVHDAAQMYLKDVKKLSKVPFMPECRHCPLGFNGRCVGACLSYRLKRGDSLLTWNNFL